MSGVPVFWEVTVGGCHWSTWCDDPRSSVFCKPLINIPGGCFPAYSIVSLSFSLRFRSVSCLHPSVGYKNSTSKSEWGSRSHPSVWLQKANGGLRHSLQKQTVADCQTLLWHGLHYSRGWSSRWRLEICFHTMCISKYSMLPAWKMLYGHQGKLVQAILVGWKNSIK
jgi:hypothetical protein